MVSAQFARTKPAFNSCLCQKKNPRLSTPILYRSFDLTLPQPEDQGFFSAANNKGVMFNT
jgi:hypothetical protein